MPAADDIAGTATTAPRPPCSRASSSEHDTSRAATGLPAERGPVSADNLNPQQFPPDEDLVMRAGDLPYAASWQSSSGRVRALRNVIRSQGYDSSWPPITILREGGKEDRLIDGNHRTEAMQTADDLRDLEVPVRVTHRRPDWLKC